MDQPIHASSTITASTSCQNRAETDSNKCDSSTEDTSTPRQPLLVQHYQPQQAQQERVNNEQIQTQQPHQHHQHHQSSIDMIYRDKRSLPPTKRFKNYSFAEESSSKNEATISSSSSTSSSSYRLDPSPDEGDDRLVIDDINNNSATITSQKQQNVDNKLLDLAKIALERETN